MTTSLVLFTRDLRVHDQPALTAAARAIQVVPLFVATPTLLGGPSASPNRAAFLAESLRDLDGSLQRLGAGLVVRHGDPVEEALRVARQHGVGSIHLQDDVGAYALTRRRRLRRACAEAGIEVHLHRGVTVVHPGDVQPASGEHFRVFTPYWRHWRAAPWRDPLPVPRHLRLPEHLDRGTLPDAAQLTPGDRSPARAPGGEEEGRRILTSWLRSRLAGYEDGHDDLAGDRTSHLSPHLHLGTLSAAEVAARALGREGAEPFLRQLCWRDFHHQVLAAFPRLDRQDYRPRDIQWREDPEAFGAWQEGRTGIDIVDAGMRQLLREGWMHNRARLLVASHLTKTLRLDWRLGAAHFRTWLLDGDVANNSGNWQWVAGTGNDTRPNRTFNVARQAARFDPDGHYRARYLD